MTHWAAHLIGKPYEAGASGPDSFDCVGLVRYYFRERYSIELPYYQIDGPEEDLRAFIKATGWRRTNEPMQEDDVLTMENLEGRHTGVLVANSQGLGMLHAQGNNQRGQVVWQPVNTLMGYRRIETWRKAC